MIPFARVSLIGLGLIGSSVARAVKAQMPSVRVTGYDADDDVRVRSRELGLCDDITDQPGSASSRRGTTPRRISKTSSRDTVTATPFTLRR